MTRSRLLASPFHFRRLATLRLLCATALCLLLAQPAGAARDNLPVGRWQARGSGLRLQILPKNKARLIGDRNTTAFEITFAPEATVRREYWMGVKEIKSVEHKVKPLPKTKEKETAASKQKQAQKQAKQNAKAEDSQKKPLPIPNEGPLRLAWLTPDAKLIVSFLIEQPPPKKPKSKRRAEQSASRAAKSQSQTAADAQSKGGTAKSERQSDKQTKTEQSAAKDSPKTPVKKQASAKPPPKKEKPRGPIPILELLVFRDGKLVHEAIFERAR